MPVGSALAGAISRRCGGHAVLDLRAEGYASAHVADDGLIQASAQILRSGDDRAERVRFGQT